MNEGAYGGEMKRGWENSEVEISPPICGSRGAARRKLGGASGCWECRGVKTRSTENPARPGIHRESSVLVPTYDLVRRDAMALLEYE